MKKLLIAAALVIASTGIFAQAQPKKDPAATSKMTPVKKADPAKVVPLTKPATTATPVKKDGTADMRYKANKDAVKTTPSVGPTKKDGTADMRYKVNKDAKKKN